MTTPRVLIHVQHLLGIGHLKRATAIAGALSAAGARVALASGGVAVPEVEGPAVARGVELVRLAPAHAADADFSKVLDDQGRPIDAAWQQRRRAALLGLFARFLPDAVITEMYPFGRRPFRFELLPLLEAAHAMPNRPVIAASVRDILVGKRKAGRAEESAAIARRLYDLVLVHGDPELIRFEASFPPAAEIGDLIRYTGYVTDAAVAHGVADRSEGEVLVSAGGGAVGFPLLAAAIAARPLSRERDRPWRLITGANLPDRDFGALKDRIAGHGGMVLERFRGDFPALLARCGVSVSQGGYNTVLEVLANRTPAVVVPFSESTESEQIDRARLLAAKGLLRLIPPSELTPERLALEIDSAAEVTSGAKTAETSVDLRGAERSAALVLAAIAARRGGKAR